MVIANHKSRQNLVWIMDCNKHLNNRIQPCHSPSPQMLLRLSRELPNISIRITAPELLHPSMPSTDPEDRLAAYLARFSFGVL